MLTTTTPTVEGRRIGAYKGIVAGEAILGAHFVKDLFARMTDVLGGRAGTYERELREARTAALAEMRAEAKALGANAVVGVSLDSEVLGGEGGSMLMVVASGTAVVLAD